MKNRKGKTTFPREVLQYLMISVISGLLLLLVLLFLNQYLYDVVISPRIVSSQLAAAADEFQAFVTEKEVSSQSRISWQSDTGNIFYMHNLASGKGGPSVSRDKSDDLQRNMPLGNEESVEIQYEDTQAETVFLMVENRWPFYAGAGLVILLAVCFTGILFYRQLSKKARYMTEIERGTFILESGQLTHAIAEEGNDELTQIAHSINEMSRSLSEKITSEEKATQASREIIGDLSHDIRTPLTILMGYVPILLQSELTKEQRKYLELIDKKTHQLNRRVDTLLEYATITSGQQPLRLEPVPVQKLLEQFVLELSPVTEVRLVSQIPPDTTMIGDVKMLERLFDNLISNMNQYADLEQGVDALLEVKESWIVIELKNTVSQEDTGVGKSLGLKISARIAELHNAVFEGSQDGEVYKTRIEFPIYSGDR
ncbi:MAG: histidine kinase dimerization/phospho-acceptor domain-containing protein [Lachnospiraceae bacterium]